MLKWKLFLKLTIFAAVLAILHEQHCSIKSCKLLVENKHTENRYWTDIGYYDKLSFLEEVCSPLTTSTNYKEWKSL